MIISIKFLKVRTSTMFTLSTYILSMYIQPRYFYLFFRSVNANNMNWVILYSVRPLFCKNGFLSIHLNATVHAVDVKSMTPGVEY